MYDREKCIQKLKTGLVGQSVNYILKSPDMLFYDFGFGKDIVFFDKFLNVERTVAAYTVHAQCYIKIMWRKEIGEKAEWLVEDTSVYMVKNLEDRLKGLIIKRVDLDDANDMWMDLGSCCVVFVTTENEEESWRFLSHLTGEDHLVATNEVLSIE